MTNEELNTALYEKMFAEQEVYRSWLISQPPEEILNHTYEYTVREDILMSMEFNDLPSSQARAMLASPQPAGRCIQGLGAQGDRLHGGHLADRGGAGQDGGAKTETNEKRTARAVERSGPVGNLSQFGTANAAKMPF